jgi:hypothetical protein
MDVHTESSYVHIVMCVMKNGCQTHLWQAIGGAIQGVYKV